MEYYVVEPVRKLHPLYSSHRFDSCPDYKKTFKRSVGFVNPFLYINGIRNKGYEKNIIFTWFREF